MSEKVCTLEEIFRTHTSQDDCLSLLSVILFSPGKGKHMHCCCQTLRFDSVLFWAQSRCPINVLTHIDTRERKDFIGSHLSLVEMLA